MSAAPNAATLPGQVHNLAVSRRRSAPSTSAPPPLPFFLFGALAAAARALPELKLGSRSSRGGGHVSGAAGGCPGAGGGCGRHAAGRAPGGRPGGVHPVPGAGRAADGAAGSAARSSASSQAGETAGAAAAPEPVCACPGAGRLRGADAGGRAAGASCSHQHLGYFLGLCLRSLLRQHLGHHRGLRVHNTADGLRQGLFHRLCAPGRATHHVAADCLRPAPVAAADPRTPVLAECALGLEPPAGCPLAPGSPAGGHRDHLLRDAGCHLCLPGGGLELPGCLLLLLHLPVHHRPGGLCARGGPWPGLPGALQGAGHSLPLPGPGRHGAGSADFPPYVRPSRPHRAHPAATSMPYQIRRGRGRLCGRSGSSARATPAAHCRITHRLRLHPQVAGAGARGLDAPSLWRRGSET